MPGARAALVVLTRTLAGRALSARTRVALTLARAVGARAHWCSCCRAPRFVCVRTDASPLPPLYVCAR